MVLFMLLRLICNKILFVAFLFLFCFLLHERSECSVQPEKPRVWLLAGRETFVLVGKNSYPLSVPFSCYYSVHPLNFLKVPLLFLSPYFITFLLKAKYYFAIPIVQGDRFQFLY